MQKYTKLYQAKGYTRDDLATLYGVCPSSISNRAKNPTPEQLLALDGLPEKKEERPYCYIYEENYKAGDCLTCGGPYERCNTDGLPEKDKEEESTYDRR